MPPSGRCTGQRRHSLRKGTALLAAAAGTLLAATPAFAQIFFFEDFETVTAAVSTQWTIETVNATASIDTTNPATGKQALRLDVMGNGRALLTPTAFAPAGNSFYGRVNLFVDNFPTAPDFSHWMNVQLTGTGDGTMLRPLGGQFIPGQGVGQNTFWGVGADGGPTGDWTNWKTTQPAVNGQYVCFEYFVNAADNSVTVSMDGVPQPQLTVNQTSHGGMAVDLIFPVWNKIQMGWWNFQATPFNFVVLMDDIALSTTPIGCPVRNTPPATTTTTAAPPAATTVPTMQGLFFTEDFEGLTVATSAKWTIETVNATASIDTTNPATGTQALRLDVMGNGRALLTPTAFAPAGNSFYGRVNLYVDNYPTSPNFSHWMNVQLTGTGDGTMLRPVGGQFIPGQGVGQNTFWGVGADGGPTGDWTNWKTTQPAVNAQYVCFEYFVNAADNSVTVSMDGVPQPQLTVNQTSHGGMAVDLIFPVWNKIQMGWWNFQATPFNFVVLMDDIALSTTPIGCPVRNTPPATNPTTTTTAAAPAATTVPTMQGLFFTEDFEGLTAATSAKWTIETVNATASIDTTNPATGTQALRLDVMGNGRALLTPTAFAPAGNSFYGRVNLYVDNYPTSPNFSHWMNVQLTGTGDGTMLRPVGGQFIPGQGVGQNTFWGVGADGGPTGDWTNWKTTQPAVNAQYVCFEYFVNAVGNSVTVSMDGVPQPQLTVNQTSHGGMAVDLVFPVWNKIQMGWWNFQATPFNFVVLMDDIALSTAPIGCPVRNAPGTTTPGVAVASPTGGAGAGVFFAEDFEALTTATSAQWTIEMVNATASIETANPATGKQALRLDVMGNGRALLTPTTFAPAGNSFYGRVNLFVDNFPTTPDFSHWMNVQLTGTGDGTMLRPIGGQFIPGQGVGQNTFWGVGADGGPTGDWTNWKTTQPAVNAKYVCFEYFVNAVGNSVTVSMDGVPQPQLTVNQTSHGGTAVDLIFPVWNKIQMGWWNFQATPFNFVVLLDDIALSTSPIGCPVRNTPTPTATGTTTTTAAAGGGGATSTTTVTVLVTSTVTVTAGPTTTPTTAPALTVTHMVNPGFSGSGWCTADGKLTTQLSVVVSSVSPSAGGTACPGVPADECGLAQIQLSAFKDGAPLNIVSWSGGDKVPMGNSITFTETNDMPYFGGNVVFDTACSYTDAATSPAVAAAGITFTATALTQSVQVTMADGGSALAAVQAALA
ncbi:hypothetical protein DFJ73DRAFT_898745 [Zopfochytrium polystomum]|nr:hypothetical protein DFJ73DRAFT_898745 [Zopfochytrium polystomum]